MSEMQSMTISVMKLRPEKQGMGSVGDEPTRHVAFTVKTISVRLTGKCFPNMYYVHFRTANGRRNRNG